MNKFVQRFINFIISIVTTFLIMISPIAAVIYLSENIETVKSYQLSFTNDTNPLKIDDTENSTIQGDHPGGKRK